MYSLMLYQMGALAKAHYSRALKQHMFQMLGSLEAFGNPVGLVRGMGQVSSTTCTLQLLLLIHISLI
jgi:Vacuolar-sorting-associated 13 protein C-terminal